jgi:beta-galactosidase
LKLIKRNIIHFVQRFFDEKFVKPLVFSNLARLRASVLVLNTFVLILPFLGNAQSVTGEPAGIPELHKKYEFAPWEDPAVTSINRQPSRATAYSYSNVEEALKGDRTKSRIQMLNGDWDFKYAVNLEKASKDFY